MNKNRTRPGVYVNVGVDQLSAVSYASSGIVTIGLDLDWGAEGFTMISQYEDPTNKLGYALNDPKMISIREILKKAQEVLVYRLNSGNKASATLSENVVAEAVYSGIRGNDISIIVSIEEESEIATVKTYLGTAEVDVQHIKKVSDFVRNGIINLSGDGILTNVTTQLVGGSNKVVAKSYDAYLTALQTQKFHCIAYNGTDRLIKEQIVQFVKQERDNMHLIQAVMENYDADHEGVISVKNGVILEDGTELMAKDCCAFVAGVTAEANVLISNTFMPYPGAIDAYPRLTNSQIEQAIKEGHVCFTFHSNTICVEYDINTLVTYTTQKPKDFRKNKIIRVIDRITDDVISICETRFIGKTPNNLEGRNRIKGALAEYLLELQSLGAIEDFASSDIDVKALADKDSVSIALAIKPVDAVDKIYIEVEVR